MKLNEIIQSTIQTLTPSAPFDTGKQFQDFYSNTNYNDSNKGAYSYIDPSDNPFEIQKKSIIAKSDATDPFFKFATFLMDADLMNSNPFFPRIYNIKTQKDADGLRIYDATIEKLQPISVMSKDVQDAMADMLLDVVEASKSLHTRFMTSVDIEKRLKKSKYLKSTALTILFETIRLILIWDAGLLKYVKSHELVIALEELIQFVKNNKGTITFDIQDSNFMVRQGGTGYQLVINDPVEALQP